MLLPVILHDRTRVPRPGQQGTTVTGRAMTTRRGGCYLHVSLDMAIDVVIPLQSVPINDKE